MIPAAKPLSSTLVPLWFVVSLLKTEADIRKRRQKMIYDQEERRRKFFEICAIIIASLALLGMIVGFTYLVMYDRGYL